MTASWRPGHTPSASGPRRLEDGASPAASRHAAGRRFRPGDSRSRLPAAAVADRRLPVGRPAPQSGTAGRRSRAAGSARGGSRRTPRRRLYWGRRDWPRCDSGVDRGFDQAGRRFDKSRLRARRVRVARAFTSIEYQDTCSAGSKTDWIRSRRKSRSSRRRRLSPSACTIRAARGPTSSSTRCWWRRSPSPKSGCSASSAGSSTGCRCRTARPSWQTEGWKLAGMAFIVLFVLPGTVWFHSLLNQQTLMGNYPMRIRWQVHRYLLKQSMTFYQDEFAGRIATKLMQTALAVRECVIKLIDVLELRRRLFPRHAGASSARPTGGWPRRWRLARRLRRAAALLRPAARQGRRGAGRRALDDDRPRRRQLHQHPDGQAVLARAPRGVLRARGHGELPRHGLPLDAAGHHAVRLALHAQLAAAVLGRPRCRSGCGSATRCRSARSPWSSAWCCGCGACRNGSCGRWPACSRTSARCRTASARSRCRRLVEDRPGAKDIVVPQGEIRSSDIGFHYGKRQGRHREPVADRAAGREGRPGRPLRRRQVDAGQPAAALLRPRERPHPDRRAGHRARSRRIRCAPDRHGHAGHLAAAPLGARQHPLRPARCQPRR